jgi:D-glycero-D-manno-heptose 1,7-bisphosphate phosphatase
MTKTLLLDRDGTINRDTGHILGPSDIEILPGVGVALRKFQDKGWQFIIVTNQGAIGRGQDTLENYQACEKRVEELLAEQGITIVQTYFCPDAEQNAPRRKPNTGMWEDIRKDYPDIRAEDCVMVGDKDADIQFGKNIGAATARIASGQYPQTQSADYTIKDIPGLASLLL